MASTLQLPKGRQKIELKIISADTITHILVMQSHGYKLTTRWWWQVVACVTVGLALAQQSC